MNDQELYTNSFIYWANNVQCNKSLVFLSDPLWNDHKPFAKWLLETHGARVKIRNLNISLEFDNPQDRTLFVLRWA